MKKAYLFILLLLTAILINTTFLSFALAQSGNQAQTTVIPKVQTSDCNTVLNDYEKAVNSKIGNSSDKLVPFTNDVLACAINTGRISLSMLPYIIRNISNYMLGLVSLVAMIFVSLGGFFYVMGGVSAKKDQGKEYIKNALIGMALAFLAWSIVNTIIFAVTSL